MKNQEKTPTLTDADRIRILGDALGALGTAATGETLLEYLHARGVQVANKYKPGKRRPSTAKRVTPAIRDAVKREHQHTQMTMSQIAAKYNINGGRVSEIINGMYDGMENE